MDNDLSLSQALGGLRIANPDDASSPPAQQHSHQIPNDQPASPTPNMLSSAASNAHRSNATLPAVATGDGVRPLSTLDFDPSSYSIETIDGEKPALTQQSPTPVSKQPSQRKQNRQSTALPLTYQAQQQAQFPQYPTVMPQHERPYNSSGRPSSMFHPPPQPTSPLPARDGSYRLQKEPSQTSLTGNGRRQASRAAAAAMQAGVPSRESSHSERTYRGSQSARVNGPLPPRRSSRGIGSTPISLPNGHPYAPETGPAASTEEWQEKGAAVGMRQELDSNGQSVQKYVKKGVKDFLFGRTLGEGSYSTVMLAQDRQTLKEYAIKVLDKRHIIKEKKVKYVNIERDTLNRLTDHPGVVRLYYTFQDERSLYFVLDLATGGELLGVLKRMSTFDEECTQFYGAQILDTIDYMHSRGVIHRDLKPENVLMDDQMHIKITDFGTAKILDAPKKSKDTPTGVPLPGQEDGGDSNRAISFVGTAEYVSPELLTEKNAGKVSDLWAFGCIIYQLLAGRPPFKAANEYLTFQKIVALDYSFPSGFPMVARDLVERLLVLDPSRRLTMDHVKNHEFFDGIKWGRGLWQQKAPRLKSHNAPPVAPIKLNGATVGIGVGNVDHSFPPDMTPAHSTKPVHISSGGNNNGNSNVARPAPRIITELPPPSQLDIEWSPVLTRNNERILKLGNQLVMCASAASSPTGKDGKEPKHNNEGSKFSRFFGGGGTTKKRQRLVMVTSSGRVLVAPSGDEKKLKFEVSFMSEGCSWRKMQDSKGLSFWVIDTVSGPPLMSFYEI